MVDLLEGIATTRAIRRYRSDPIPDEDLAEIFFAASRAPTGSNRQPTRFVVLRDGPRAAQAKSLMAGSFREAWDTKRRNDGFDRGSVNDVDSPKARLTAAMDHFVDHFEEIPVVVLPCLIRYRDPNPMEGSSVYPGVQNLLLAARALGYGGVFTGWHRGVEAGLRELLEIPDGVAMHGCIAMGRPMGGHGPVRRRPIRELVYDDVWEGDAPWALDPPDAAFSSGGPPRQG